MTARRKRTNLSHVSTSSRPDEMLAPEVHARQHARVRKAHETELIEDYVELIADLIDAKGEARAVEIARRMDVRQATVSKMLQRLQERGLVTSEPYRSVFLTHNGRHMAEDSRARHAVVLDFLRTIGVPEESALQDAEGMEHHVSDATLDAMRRFIRRHSNQEN